MLDDHAPAYLNVRDVLKYERLVVTEEAFAVIEGLLGAAGGRARRRAPGSGRRRWSPSGATVAWPDGGLRWQSFDVEDVIRRPLITEKNTG